MAITDLAERVKALEIQRENDRQQCDEMEVRLQGEIAELKKKVAYYDKMALKWGSFLMGVLFLGALLASGIDKLKDKIIAAVLGS